MLRPAIEETITAFEQREVVLVTRVYNGCGILVAQMKSGRVPDAYFACDSSFVTDVQEWFGRPVPVSQNDLVLIVPKGNPKRVKPSLRELARKDLRIGVPHPTNSALGKLTDELLKKHGWYDEAHMANDVRDLAGAPPHALLGGELGTPVG